MLPNAKMSVYGRDNAMELIIKFMPRKDGLGWPFKMIAVGGNLFIVDFVSNYALHCC